MITKQDLLSLYGQELKTTAKVIAALPEGNMDYKPNEEKSNSLKSIVNTLIVGNFMNMKFLKGEQPSNSMDGVPEFDSIAGAVEANDKMAAEFMSALEAASDEDLQQPFSMWGMEGTRADIIMGMMRDMIHHRGQLSVYIRLLNGKVPSIYGPTADDQ